MPDKDSEVVMVVPGAELDRIGRFHGFSTDAERYLDALLRPEHVRFKSRGEVEHDPSLKQIIPYVVVRSGQAVFAYRRGKSQGESRLHSLRSIGIGGHVEERDAEGRPSRAGYEIALQRELDEEVTIASPGRLRLAGLINDDSTPVGAVHLGVVHVLELDEPEAKAREDGLADAGFYEVPAIVADRASFETWSQFCIDALLIGT